MKLCSWYWPKQALLLIGLIFIAAACDDAAVDELAIATDTNVSVNYVDTTTIKVSTVLLDSIATSNSGTILAGKYTDPLLGTTQASAYFQIYPNTNDTWNPEAGAVLDSVALIMPYLGLSYGDTLQPITLNVYRLTQTPETRQVQPYLGTEETFSYFYGTAALYNTSKTAAETQPLGTLSFKPRPSRNDSVSITLPKSLGQEWLQLSQAGDNRLSNATDFLAYFKGLKVSANSSGSVVGFDAAQTKVRVYYRQTSGDVTENLTYDFALLTGSTQYNQLTTDYSATALAGISPGGNPVPSTATNNMGFTQSGTGLMVKVEFPYLTQLKEILDPSLINKVLLEIEPVTGTNLGFYRPPGTLALYETDQNNIPTGPVYTNYTTTEQTAGYILDAEFNLNSYYRFDVTQHFINRFGQSQAQQNALLLSAPRDTFVQTLNRLAVGGPNHQNSIKLKIYYTKIQ